MSYVAKEIRQTEPPPESEWAWPETKDMTSAALRKMIDEVGSSRHLKIVRKRFIDRVDLEHIDQDKLRLCFTECQFMEGSTVLARSDLDGLEFRRCRLDFLDIDRINIRRDLIVEECSFGGGLSADSAQVAGQVYLDLAAWGHRSGTAVNLERLSANQIVVHGYAEWDADGSRPPRRGPKGPLGGRLSLRLADAKKGIRIESLRLAHQNHPAGVSAGGRTSIDCHGVATSDLEIENCDLDDGLCLDGAKIDGALKLANSRLGRSSTGLLALGMAPATNRSGFALTARNLNVDKFIANCPDLRLYGRVDLMKAKIGWLQDTPRIWRLDAAEDVRDLDCSLCGIQVDHLPLAKDDSGWKVGSRVKWVDESSGAKHDVFEMLAALWESQANYRGARAAREAGARTQRLRPDSDNKLEFARWLSYRTTIGPLTGYGVHPWRTGFVAALLIGVLGRLFASSQFQSALTDSPAGDVSCAAVERCPNSFTLAADLVVPFIDLSTSASWWPMHGASSYTTVNLIFTIAPLVGAGLTSIAAASTLSLIGRGLSDG